MTKRTWSQLFVVALLAGCSAGGNSGQPCPQGCPEGYVCTVQSTCVPNTPLSGADAGRDAVAQSQVFDSGSASVVVDGSALGTADSGTPGTIISGTDAAAVDSFAVGTPNGTGDANRGLDSASPAVNDASPDAWFTSTSGPDSSPDRGAPSPDTFIVPPTPDSAMPVADAFVATPDSNVATPDTVPPTPVDAFVPCQPQKATGNAPMIDDLSDGDAVILQQEGRSGTWHVYNDGTGTQVPAPGAKITPTGNRICTSGFGFTDWGSGVGVNFNTDNVNLCTYDASVYKGVKFTIEGSITSSYLRFAIPTKDIASSDAGGACNSSLYKCNDNYGANIYYSTTAGFYCANGLGTFACTSAGPGNSLVFTIPFAEMTQEGWGQTFPIFDTTKMLTAHWEIKNSSRLSSSSYTLCMGAIGFY